MSQWITENQSAHLRLSAEVDKVLFSGESQFQKIEVAHSLEYGNMLVLDGVFQTSEKEEFVYHEMMSHVPLFLHPNPKNVLIIGGGDGGVARECVRHDCVEKVTMVEIDGKVVELAKQYLPTIADAMIRQDPKLTVKIGDGIGFMAQADNEYDVIIVDCSDPIGPGEGLFTKEFYANVHKALKADGLFVQQTESPVMHKPLVEKVFGYVRDRFAMARLYTAYIPIYPTGMHCFTMGTKTYDPLTFVPNRERTFTTKYYNEKIQTAAFALPNFVKEYLLKK